MFFSASEMRFEGISSGSASQLELALAAEVGAGSDVVFALAWSDLLDLVVAGASMFLAAVRLRFFLCSCCCCCC